MNPVTTTAAARVSAMMWQIAVEDSSTHCHQACPCKGGGLAADPRGGLVGADHRAGAHRLRQRFGGGDQRRLCAGQDVGDGAFADGHPEHLRHQLDEALKADRLGDAAQGSAGAAGGMAEEGTCRWMMSADRPGPNGEPGSKPSGAGAATRVWQQGQTPRWRLMRVTMGRSGGRSR